MGFLFRSKRRLIAVGLLVAATSLVYFMLMLFILGRNCLKPDKKSDIFPSLKTAVLSRNDAIHNRRNVFGNINVKSFTENSRILPAVNSLLDKSQNEKGHVDNHSQGLTFHTSIRKEMMRNSVDVGNYRKSSVNKSVMQAVETGMFYNCSSISRTKLLRPIGRGVSKQAFLGEIDGAQVAVKMVTRHIHAIKECLDKFKTHTGKQSDHEKDFLRKKEERKDNSNNFSGQTGNQGFVSESNILKKFRSGYETRQNVLKLKEERERCYVPATAKFLREILLSMELKHRNIVSFLGYCVRNDEHASTDMTQHGVVAVYELGSRFYIDRLQILPWQKRLQHTLELADLLVYLHKSPLGSLIVPDIKEGHFVTVRGRLKLIDLDDLSNLEPECEVTGQMAETCGLDTECIGNICEGFNARKNLHNFNRLLFKRLLYPATFPDHVIRRVGQLNAKLDSVALTADDLKSELLEIMADLGVDDDDDIVDEDWD